MYCNWACLGLKDHIDRTIAARGKEVKSRVRYKHGRIGGRARASDGLGLKWRVTQENFEKRRAQLSVGLGTHPGTGAELSHYLVRI